MCVAPVGPVLKWFAVESAQVWLAGHGEGSQDGRRHRYRGNEDVRVGP